jgi:hypothetical protein
MNVREAFDKLVSGEIESFNIVDESGFQIRVSDKCFAMDAHWVCPAVPETEEVEVKQIATVRVDNGTVFAVYDEGDEIEEGFPEFVAIQLTGSYTRPIPKKVKKRVLVGHTLSYGIHWQELTEQIPAGAKIFAEYEEDA